MATKRWRLAVKELGGSEQASERTVEADNWMAALRAGRTEMGESGGVPTGASCAVAADGEVTVLDPTGGRRYVLTPVEAPAAKASTGAHPSPASGPGAAPDGPQPQQAGAGSGRARKGTMAYVQSPAASSPPAAKEVVVGGDAASSEPGAPSSASSQPPGGTPSKRPSAPPPPSQQARARRSQPPGSPQPNSASEPPPSPQSSPSSQPPPPPQAQPASQPPPPPASPPSSSPSQPPAGTSPAAAPAAPQPSTQPSAGSGASHFQWALLSQRDQDPSSDTPLYYRERTYLVPEGTSEQVAAALLQARLTDLQQELHAAPPGKFCNLAVFDHRWENRPKRPPVATLQWKDWRGDPKLDFPLSKSKANAPSSTPSPPPPARERRSSTGEENRRLAEAFEACQDLLFQESAADALEFVIDLLQRLVPNEASTAALYDIDADELRFVALSGAGAEDRKRAAVSPRTGIFAAAARTEGAAVRIADLASDARFDPAKEGRPGLEPRTALYMSVTYEGRLLGMLQLLNRKNAPEFTESDGELVAYVGGQLAEFLYQARIRPHQEESKR